MSMILLLCEPPLRTGKTQAAAKGKPRAQSFPVSQGPGRCQEKSWQTRAFFATASLRSTPGKRGTSTPGRKSSLLLSSEVKGRAARQPLLHEIGHRQREPESTKVPRFARPGPLPKRDNERKVPRFAKSGSLPRKNLGKRAPSSRRQACGPRRVSEGRVPRDVKVLCFFLSRKKRRKKAARRGRLFFSGLPFLSTQTPGRSGRPR